MIDELELDVTVLQGRVLATSTWTSRVLCCDVGDLKRRHVCRSCEISLAPRRVYCSEKCRLTFEQDHFWGLARARSLKRAQVEAIDLEAARTLTPELILARIGKGRREIFVLDGDLRQGPRRRRPRRARYWRCAKCSGITEEPEVNHITPVLGGNRSVTCLNHEENLEVLCHSCHLAATAQQLADRRRR